MSVFRTYNKEEHLQRAMDLLNSDNMVEHVYACLELRFCIEAIVYQKLLHGIDGLPNTIVETWQPNKALKMLIEFDRLSGSDCVIEVHLSNSSEPPKEGWIKLGEQKFPPVQWINKSYNKLGNFLHLVEPKKAEKSADKNIKSEVLDIAEELGNFVKGNILLSFNNLDIKQCPACKQDIAFSLEKVRDGELCKCSNRSCGALFKVNVDELSKSLTLSCDIYEIKCENCSADIVVHESSIRNLNIIECESCNVKYIPKGHYEFAFLPK